MTDLHVRIPDELAEQLAIEARDRGVAVDVVLTALLVAGLGHSESSSSTGRRHLAFAGIGASGSSRGAAQGDELLAEGFGRD